MREDARCPPGQAVCDLHPCRMSGVIWQLVGSFTWKYRAKNSKSSCEERKRKQKRGTYLYY